MALSIRRNQVWSGEITDRPGAAAAKLEYLAYKQAVTEASFPSKPYNQLQISDQIRAHKALHTALQSIAFEVNRADG